VEGSTGLIRQVGDLYGEILAEHRRILRGAVAGHGGHEVDTTGDGSFVAFASARDGVAAAVAAQREMAAHSWPGDADVRTRMALHTGEPRRAEEGYHGLGVHLAARLCQAGAGGQILLSSSTRAVVADDLPAGVSVRDLGERALKDFDRPQAVYEAVIDDVAPPDAAATAAVRVVLAEDSVLLREGIARLLESTGFEVVGQVDNADDLVRRVGFSKPDVAIIDIRMPPTHTDEGLQAARAIREEMPGTGVVVLSAYVEAAYALELLGDDPAGVGYLLKDRVWDGERFAEAVRRVAEGGSALDPEVVSHMLGRQRGEPLEELTPREHDVLALMAEGRSNQAIADALVISGRAVEKHVSGIFTKLHLPPAPEDHRRVLAVLAFLRS
jgi:DNA-binding NarL/FixJ family response regulator